MFFKKKEPQTVDVLGRPFRCLVCHHDLFWLGRAQLNTALATFFKFDWANRSAAHVSCAKCGHISWFKQ
ncbi:hypothetical protein C9I43_03635 [Shewanella morhuae]|uniref:Nucleic-acid-binding protein containing Zn-ribbon domain (DUF2082) n=1 Tax=Shewanella morhuae TaxID=365591 RepID=A0A1N6TQG1_9GAMM|nr:hypothetical protein C9I43_03635 [Shewanella morhuae]SIQ55543.1 hypothetical protein SAMN05421840_102106 [Shewanella morhuae]SUI61358.1 Uncharacterised protein [Shewanella morhuae]